MKKAIAIQAVFLIGVIGIFLFFIVSIFWGWIDTTKFATSEATCTASKIGYCSALTSKTKLPEWNNDCSKYNINKPVESDCKISQPLSPSK